MVENKTHLIPKSLTRITTRRVAIADGIIWSALALASLRKFLGDEKPDQGIAVDDGSLKIERVIETEKPQTKLKEIDSYDSEKALQLLSLINEYRKTHGLGEVVEHPALTALAKERALGLADENYSARPLSPDESDFPKIAKEKKLPSDIELIGEHLYPKDRSYTASRLFRETLSIITGQTFGLDNPEYKYGGIAVYSRGNKMWCVMDFAKPATSAK